LRFVVEIKIGQVGRIVAGDEMGSYIKVEDDTHNTGGYLVLTATKPDMTNGFDNWVEDGAALSRYFAEAEWIIEWL
jgi:hypothetical protein